MSRYFAATSAAAVVCAALALVLSDRADADSGVILRTGTVVTAGDQRLTIRDDKDDEQKHSFLVPSDTYITLNGRDVALEDLKPGYFARVSAKSSSDKPVAMAIEAGADIAHRF